MWKLARNTLPIHCIIERVNTGPGSGNGPGSNVATTCQPSSPSLTGNTDLSMANSSPQSANVGNNNSIVNTVANAGGSTIEQDTYAILPSTIPYCDIVRAVLTKLGYASQEMIGAKGRFNFVVFLPRKKTKTIFSIPSIVNNPMSFWNIPNWIYLIVKVYLIECTQPIHTPIKQIQIEFF